MECPKCEKAELAPIKIDNQEVQRCLDCAGTWFKSGQLILLLKQESSRLKPLLGGEEREELNLKGGCYCPVDGEELLRVYSAQNRAVVIDTCSQCDGVWLDGGEYEKIRRGIK